MFVHMYMANSSSNDKRTKVNFEKLRLEKDIVNKSKRWIVDMLSDLADDSVSKLIIPQWLHQINNSYPSSFSIQPVQDSPTDRSATPTYDTVLAPEITMNTSKIQTNVGDEAYKTKYTRAKKKKKSSRIVQRKHRNEIDATS